MANDLNITFPGEPAPANAAVVPVESPATGPARLDDPISVLEAVAYGANNEHLPDRLQAALRRIVFDFTT